MQIAIKDDAICPLLYTDGTFKNMFNYPENVLDWLDFLCANDVANPLHKVFYNNCYSTNKLMLALRDFFAAIKAIGGTSRGGDKIVISNSRSRGPENLDQDGSRFKLNGAQVEIANKFLSMLAEQTGWGYRPEKWAFENFNVFQFEKGTIKPNGRNYEDMLRRKPLSWAMTSGQAIEYTVEGPHRLA